MQWVFLPTPYMVRTNWTNHLMGGLNFYLCAGNCFTLQSSDQNATRNADLRKNISDQLLTSWLHTKIYTDHYTTNLDHAYILPTCKIPPDLSQPFPWVPSAFSATILLRGTPRHLHIHPCFTKIWLLTLHLHLYISIPVPESFTLLAKNEFL